MLFLQNVWVFLCPLNFHISLKIYLSTSTKKLAGVYRGIHWISSSALEHYHLNKINTLNLSARNYSNLFRSSLIFGGMILFDPTTAFEKTLLLFTVLCKLSGAYMHLIYLHIPSCLPVFCDAWLSSFRLFFGIEASPFGNFGLIP